MNKSYIIDFRLSMLAIFASVLIHCCILFYLIFEKKSSFALLEDKLVKNEQNDRKDKEREEWVTRLAARSSENGADVLFKDEPDDDLEAFYSHINDEQMLCDGKSTKVTPQVQSEQEQKEDSSTFLDQKVADELTNTSVELVIVTQKRARDLNHSQAFFNNSKNNKIVCDHSKPLIMPKKLLSLADLTKGILGYAKSEGSSAISVIGTKTEGVASAEQIKYERYFQKLSLCFRDSFVINKNKFPYERATGSPVIVYISINRDGILQGLRVEQSSGDLLVDQFVLAMLHDASNSFPPVPHYLSADPFDFYYTMTFPGDKRPLINMYKQ